ncbi:hypothetical protein PCANC_00510 [Puccinia coronata f. sp. avenae]|uniref:Uncharacterized protein n=1 Tax=Puccinia coronata f. sp. avenae TaxID=200324 RepID=A0A2N5W821_9BASI|nr:hypothetical protein PCANC_00510 [Puccinia coronata f. sp. avenae]
MTQHYSLIAGKHLASVWAAHACGGRERSGALTIHIKMAKLSDLPAELVDRIILYVFYASPNLNPNPDATMSRAHDHHLPIYFQCMLQPKRRPHLERIVYRGPNHPKDYDEGVSWPEGLPDNPLLPLSLVNRTFSRCAQLLLFKNVALYSTVSESLFLKSLTSTRPQKGTSSHRHERISNQVKQHDLPHLNPLAHHVRSIQFNRRRPCVMEKIGGSIICEILQSCPSLENIAFLDIYLFAVKEPILQALASKPLIKDIVSIQTAHAVETSIAQWQAHEVVLRLFSHWNSLETVEFTGLSDRTGYLSKPAPNPMPVLNCSIRTMILSDHDLNSLTLSNLLMICRESLRELTITGPGYRLDRTALCRILQECTSPNLEALTLTFVHWDPPMNPDLNSENPKVNPALLDILFNSTTALRNLKSLSFEGRMATARLLERLPQSIVKLSWERCKLPASAFIKALLRPKGTQGSLPNLKCCSHRTRILWNEREEWKVVEALKMQGGCSHSVTHLGYAWMQDDPPLAEYDSSSPEYDSFSEYDSSFSVHEDDPSSPIEHD